MTPPIYAPGAYTARGSTIAELFPTSGLVHTYLWWASEVVYAAPAYHVGAVLPLVAQEVVSRGFRLQPNNDAPRAWVCLVGGSGSGKSTAHKMAREFFAAHHSRDPAPSPFVHLGGSIQGVKHTLANDMPRSADDTVCAILENDELTRFMPRKSVSIAEDLCQLYDSRPIEDHTRAAQREKREGAPSRKLDRYVLSGLFATTLASLDVASDETYFTGGLFSRILWVHGKVDPQEWRPAIIDWQYARRQTALDRWGEWAEFVDGFLAAGGLPHVRLLPDAENEYQRFAVQYREKCFDEHGARWAPAYLRAVAEHTPRLAALFALSREEAYDTETLGGCLVYPEDVVAASKFVTYVLSGFDKVAGQVAVSQRERVTEWVLDQLRKAGREGVLKSELWRRCAVRYRDDLPHVLTQLEQADSVVACTHRTGSRGRPPTYIYLRENYSDADQHTERMGAKSAN